MGIVALAFSLAFFEGGLLKPLQKRSLGCWISFFQSSFAGDPADPL